MRAVFSSDKPGKVVELINVEKPTKIGDDEVLVKTLYCSLCHSDLSSAKGEWGSKVYRSVGHESVGEVVEVGAKVSDLKVGDYVAGPAGLRGACGECKYCKRGEEVFCDEVIFTGARGYGTMQDYTVEKAKFSIKLPKDVNLPQACIITCAGITVYKGFKLANPIAGDTVAIFGIGGLGNVAIEYAKNVFGMKVIAVGSNEGSLQIAKEKGADLVINWKTQDVDKMIQDFTNNQGLDLAMVTSSTLPQFEMAYRNLGKIGKLCSIGLPVGKLPVDILDVTLGQKTVYGSLIGTRQDLIESLQALYDKKVNPDLRVEPIEKAEEFFELMDQNKLHQRIVFDLTK
ncbi:alcohol dehydrogenase, propanol-preferring [Spiroplasma helicoides]|uniref:Alcohol dehydrogenase n=1 Tax=Spiroplasma helicoides TaxID=216938 RepID=A0A1B3SLN0_9MOLU|nr:zinc-binding dehydrogenase [Spiroplasma helicoides]AOG60838.1 alcohol dehydrogenase, propanol-preferring [Spiroplasma helicoides]